MLAELARRFGATPEEIGKRIEEAILNFQALELGKDSMVTVALARSTPLFTFYMFDSVAIFVPHSHRSQATVPAFVVAKGGSLYNYLCEARHAR